MCRDSKTAFKIYNATIKWLDERLGLQVSKEKSKVVNLNKNYSEFLGFKIRLMPKGHKKVVKSNISDKSKKKIIEQIKDKIGLMKKQNNSDYIVKYNSTILGIQNYYRIATHVNLDFSEIDFLVRKKLYNTTKSIKNKKGLVSNLYKKRYGKWNGKKIYVGGIALFPIACISHKNPMNFTQTICNYTEEGRQFIHDKLDNINHRIIKYLMENPVSNASIEFNDNRISLYVGQFGRCKVTGKILDIGEMEVHHIKPRNQGGTDEYKNLIFINYEIHKLIHATKVETIESYLRRLNLKDNQIAYVNILRSKVGNCAI